MPNLIENQTLKEFQTYVHDLEVERGFIDQTVLMKCLMMGEEVGELFKAVRKQEGIKLDHASAKVGGIDEELVDIFYFFSVRLPINTRLILRPPSVAKRRSINSAPGVRAPV